MSNLTRYDYDPFAGFEDIFGLPMFLSPRPFRRSSMAAIEGGMMRTDVEDHDDSYEVLCDIPGVDKKDINVDFDSESHRLTISHSVSKDTGDDDEKDDGKEKRFLRRERYSSYASSTVYLPDANADDIKASYADGVLHVTLGKTKPAETKTSVTVE